MSVESKLSKLTAFLGPESEVITNSHPDKFQEHAKRWTDIDRQIPAAIVLPHSEQDCQKVIQWANESQVPFVIVGGGCSEWSTIGPEGVEIDLSPYSSISVDEKAQTVRITGAVTQKGLATKLAEYDLFTALGNGNPVGVIGYALGGGSSVTNAITGYGSDQILSARLVTASGSLIDVSPTSHPDLLYAIRGAGHFFGLVTSLTLRVYPFSALKPSSTGTIWSGAIIFPLSRAAEVLPAMTAIMDDASHPTSGLIMIAAPPPDKKPALIISGRYTGETADAELAYAPLRDLKPMVFKGSQVPIQNISDGRDAFYAKGSFKRFGIVGLRRFDPDRFLQTVTLWKDLVAECPDAAMTMFNFQWDSQPVKQPDFESAMCLHDIRFWQNNFIWHTDPVSRAKVDDYNNKCIDIVRGSEDVSKWVDYQNGTRVGPIERRFRGKERLQKLRALKKEWDPNGLFTRQLLD